MTLNMNKAGLTAIVLLVMLASLALVGCEHPVAASGANEAGYTGALDVSYEGALDATSQLALGTVQLEGTPNAVTEAQARQLLPLWQALQSGVLQGTSERDAVIRQIEHTMSSAQIQAIVAMRLTDADAATWMESQAGAFSAPGGAPQGDASQWTAPQGGSGRAQRPSGAGQGLTDEQIAQMRQRFQDASPEDLATRRAQFAGQAGTTVRASAGSSRMLMAAVTRLLVERSGADAVPQEPPDATPAALVPETVEPIETPDAAPMTATPEATPAPSETSTPAETPTTETTPAPAETSTPAETPTPEATPTSSTAPTATPAAEQAAAPTSTSAVYTVRAGDTLAAIAQAYGVTVSAIAEANGIQDANVIDAGQALVIPDPARVPMASVGGTVASLPDLPSAATSGQAVASPSDVPVASASSGSLTWLPDTNPGPPFSIEVSLNRATQDPVVEKSQRYEVIGLVRNDGDQTYAISAIHVTFYDASGFRGTFSPAIRDGKLVGGEWHWHGAVAAEFAAPLLAPGESWPFSIAITGQDMTSFLIHADATPTRQQSVPVSLGDVVARDDGTGYVRITGTATNDSPYNVKGVTVSGVLLDEGGHIVSVGSTYGLESGIQPGASVSFDLRVLKEAYASYQLYAQAERDWN
jgi:LysM repeat protein